MTTMSVDGRWLARVGLIVAIFSRLAGRLVGISLAVVLSRQASAETVALYGYLLGTATLMAVLTDLGVAAVAGREVASGRLPVRAALYAALGPQIASVSIAAAVTVGLAVFAGPPSIPTAALLATVVFVVVTGFVGLWAELLRATGRVFVEGALQTAGAVALVAGGVAVIYSGGGATALLLVVAMKEVAVLAVGVVLLRPRQDLAVPSRSLLQQSVWLALAGASMVLLWRHGTVVIGAQGSVDTLATYVVATRFLDAGVVVAHAATIGLAPGMSVLAAEPPRFRRSARRYLHLTAATGALVSLVGVIFSEEVTTLTFGNRWAEAGPSVTVVAVTALPVLMVYVAWPLLLARRQMLRLVAGSVAGAVTGALTSVVLVAAKPGALSAVIGTAVGASVVAAVLLHGLRDVLAKGSPPQRLCGGGDERPSA